MQLETYLGYSIFEKFNLQVFETKELVSCIIPLALYLAPREWSEGLWRKGVGVGVGG